MVCDCRRANSSDKKIMTHYRVIGDGIDYTDDCFYADSRRRKIGIYLRGDDGRHYVKQDGTIALTWLHPRRVHLVRK